MPTITIRLLRKQPSTDPAGPAAAAADAPAGPPTEAPQPGPSEPMYSLLVTPALTAPPSPPESNAPQPSSPQPPLAPPRTSYWDATRRPLPSLLLILPVMLTYELGVLWLGQTAPAARTGADAWVRHVLASLGLTERWFPPLLLIFILLGCQAVRPRDWRFEPSILGGMVLESLLLAVALVGISRLIDVVFSMLEAQGPSVLAADASCSAGDLASLIGYLGAGVYEEAIFRLALVPVLFGLLRLLQTPQVFSSALAVTGSALVFSLAHHAGTTAETFTWFAFVFRWMAGVFFAWVFVIRGFGIAVGTHTAYDILVGWVGWHL